MWKFVTVLAGAVALLSPSLAVCAETKVGSAPSAAATLKAVVAPPPAWADVPALPEAAAPSDPPSVQTLFDDNQSWLGPDGDAYFNRRAWKILKPEGLRRFTSMSQTWDPAKGSVTFHTLRLIRGGQVIDLLGKGEKMLVLRRERDLERAMLDGSVTASQQLEGVQVGDIVEWSWTEVRRDPLLGGRSYDQEGLSFSEAARYRVLVSWPKDTANRWRATPGFPEPKLSTRDGRTLLSVDARNIEAPRAPAGAPARFRRIGALETSGFASWAEVSSLMAPHYTTAAQLEPGSELKAEAAAIAAAHKDPKARASAAMRLVQEKTRYFFIGLDDGGYVPAAADLTWSRKFGDCKGKTALLLALLNELGVAAEPALVNLGGGDGLDERPPSLAAFNHVIVRASIDGKTYWLDGTRTGDRAIDSLRPPAHRWALPVRSAGAALERIDIPPFERPPVNVAVRIDASAGLDAPAKAIMTTRMYGEAAAGMRQIVDAGRKKEFERIMRQSMSGSTEAFELETLDFKDDVANDAFEIRIVGKTDMIWRLNPDVNRREYRIQGGERRLSFPKREPGPNDDAPFAVNYPMHTRMLLEIVLPDDGRGFVVRGPNGVDTLAGIETRRSSTLKDGVARFETEARSLGPEISITEAAEAVRKSRTEALEDSLIRAPG